MIARSGTLRLRFLTGPQRGRAVILRGPRCRIGRSRDNDIVLPDRPGAESSGHHAEAVFEQGRWWIVDLGSTNGTFLNGSRVTRATFGPGDRLVFGDVQCQVQRSRTGWWAVAGAAALLVLALALSYTLRTSGGGDLERAAAEIARSVYLVAVDLPAGRQIVGTAFVVRPGVLATNAHVADAVAAFLRADPSARGVLVRNDSSETTAIEALHPHPGWQKGSLAHDAALVSVSARLDAVPVRLAPARTVSELPRGRQIASFGFPVAGTNPMMPRGRLSVDVLGDVRDGRYLAVGLKVAPGTSGSPIFLPDGLVVGMVAGGDFVSSGGTRQPSGSEVNWGVSAALIEELLR